MIVSRRMCICNIADISSNLECICNAHMSELSGMPDVAYKGERIKNE